MSKRKEITIESRRRFKSFELPPYAKYDNFYPEGQANNDNQETDALTSEIMKIIKHNPRSSAFSTEYNDSQIESPDAYTTYLIDKGFLIKGKNYIDVQRDIDKPKYELVMTIPPTSPDTPDSSSKKRKANPLSENAEDWKVKADMEKYNIYITSNDGIQNKLNTEQLKELLRLTKAYYNSRPDGVLGWSDGGKPRKTRKLKRKQNKTKRHKGKSRK